MPSDCLTSRISDPMQSPASDSNAQTPGKAGASNLVEYESIMQAVATMLPMPTRENYLRVFDRLRASSFYDPASTALDTMTTLINKGDNIGVIDCYKDANPNYVITPEAAIILSMAHKNTGNLKLATIFANAADSACKGIKSTGDGTQQRPYLLIHSRGIDGFIAFGLQKEAASSRTFQDGGRLLVAVKCKDGSEIFCDITATQTRKVSVAALSAKLANPFVGVGSNDQTLYESWQLRRQRLDSTPPTASDYIASQIHILDYLLRRYAGNPLAEVPASFPARSDLMINRRTVVVHEHIGRGLVAGIKTEQEASGRAASILKRIANVDPQASVKSPGFGIFRDADDAENESQPEKAAHGGIAPPAKAAEEATYGQRRAWGKINTAIKYGASSQEVYDLIKSSYSLSPILPERAVSYLFERVDNTSTINVLPAELLSYCTNTSALDYAMLAWRNRLASIGPDPVSDRLKHACTEEGRQKRAVALLRSYLADINGAVRMEATRMLGQLGSLDDVGLLLDLISLPPLSDELPGERGILIEVASRLSGTDPLPPKAADAEGKIGIV